MSTTYSFTNPKLGELRMPRSLFDVFEVGQVTLARITQRRDSKNEAIPDSIAKIVLDVANYKMLQAVIKNGGSLSDLATIPVEFIADEETMKRHNPETLVGQILDLREAEVALRWVSRGNSGSWGGYKLVCSGLKFMQPTTAKPAE